MGITGIMGAVKSCCGGGSKNKVGGGCGLGGFLKKLLEGLTGLGCSGGGGGCGKKPRACGGASALTSSCCARAANILG